jgi:hypothetical protein
LVVGYKKQGFRPVFFYAAIPHTPHCAV